jgi:D-alanyl-D-alanine carboxypeptidase (penicillin-binding protein 5/6)
VSRRLLPSAAVLLIAALIAVGCGNVASLRPARATGNARSPSGLQQYANGPRSDSVGPSPLAVKLVSGPDPVKMPFGKPPRAGLLFDLDTGRVLWRRNPTRVLPIASVTKIMTALVVVDQVAQGAKVKITKQALAYQGSGVGVLPKGKWVGVSAMLYGLLLPSGNDAAIALAQRTSRTVGRFVAAMNARAREMHLDCTRYSSPSGFVDAGNHSCAADLAAEARAVLDEPRLARIVARRQAVLPFPIKGGKLYLYNHNPLLKMSYPGTLGIKTGFTDAAGMCLVAAARRNGHRLGVVLLHSPNTGAQAVKLLDAGFKTYR